MMKTVEINKADLPEKFAVKIRNRLHSEAFQRWAFQELNASWPLEPGQEVKYTSAKALHIEHVGYGIRNLTWSNDLDQTRVPFIDFDLTVKLTKNIETVDVGGVSYDVKDIKRLIKESSIHPV